MMLRGSLTRCEANMEVDGFTGGGFGFERATDPPMSPLALRGLCWQA